MSAAIYQEILEIFVLPSADKLCWDAYRDDILIYWVKPVSISVLAWISSNLSKRAHLKYPIKALFLRYHSRNQYLVGAFFGSLFKIWGHFGDLILRQDEVLQTSAKRKKVISQASTVCRLREDGVRRQKITKINHRPKLVPVDCEGSSQLREGKWVQRRKGDPGTELNDLRCENRGVFTVGWVWSIQKHFTCTHSQTNKNKPIQVMQINRCSLSDTQS